MPIVNGHQAETGCYVEGHWGQYGPDHLADQAEAFGWTPGSSLDDPRIVREFLDFLEGSGYGGYDATGALWERHSETGDEIANWLNEHTPADQYGGMVLAEPGPGLVEAPPKNYVWHWHDGEFFLSPICENGDCDDDTCAHWD
jgi:hypothetical protein